MVGYLQTLEADTGFQHECSRVYIDLRRIYFLVFHIRCANVLAITLFLQQNILWP
jgi:hypothetical protein